MKKGFTLAECLVVVLIVGILSVVAIQHHQKVVEKTRAVVLVNQTRSLYASISRYYMANGSYPEGNGARGREVALALFDQSFPSSEQEKIVYNNWSSTAHKTVYCGYTTKDYMISWVLSSREQEWVSRGLTCNSTTLGKPSADDKGAKICKELCKTNTLQRVWDSGQYGCSIVY